MDQALLVFMTVAQQQNFTRAAEALHMTQPAVSSYIQGLERSLNAKLLERTNKYVRLNKAGEIVYHHAVEILSLYTRMENLLDDLKHTAHGPLSIGSSYTFGEYILPHAIAYLRSSYPTVQPSITIANSKEIIELVGLRQLDAGIIEGEIKQLDRIRAVPFAEDKMSIAAGPHHPLASQTVITPADLSRETWILREEGSGTREMQEKAFELLGFYPENLMVFGSTQAIKESIEAGLGITLLSFWTIRKELGLGALKLLDTSGFPILRHFSLITPDLEFQTKATEIFIEMLIENKGFPQL
ncbi:LysR family transcriptional regulator [Paenibacillus caui]|uniref:LysR family transcriptional regulator n=1 Tax=Paenibacillus caui TaxID=2873927 RepID=UPI001CA93278|nr:LysR family transcriptional regulator [Paenibacillus caui]